MPVTSTTAEQLLDQASPLINEIFERCRTNAPNFGVDGPQFTSVLRCVTAKFIAADDEAPTAGQIADFLNQLQADDLFLAIACAAGSERAWWDFDQQHRAFMERVAQHLAKTDIDARDVIDAVYGELYGTRVVDGERVSKFATYSGRGSLRGWLRTVIWHALVDQHRAGHDEVSLDEMTETVGDGGAHSAFAEPPSGGEREMVGRVVTTKYRETTLAAIKAAFAALGPHERLLLLYYHKDGLRLREIAKLAENESSPLRGWFQRRSQEREKNPESRIHESTIMRWLDKCYGAVLRNFRHELTEMHHLSEEEVKLCVEITAQDLSAGNIFESVGSGQNGEP